MRPEAARLLRPEIKRARRGSEQTIGSRIGYRIDRFLGLHPVVQLLAVAGSALVLAFVFGCAIVLLDDSTGAAPDQQRRVGGVVEGLWWAITRMLDGGTVTNDSGPLRQMFGIGVTLIGTITVAVLTGSFASSFTDRLSALRRGALPVFEEGHVVFLGWNIHGAVIIRELAVSGIQATLVIIADHERELVEESIREQLDRRAHRLEVVVRRGDPTTTASARRAAVPKARAVVILPEVTGSPWAPGHQADPASLSPIAGLERVALRSLLAVRRVLRGRQRPIIVEVAGPRGSQLMRLCESSSEVVVVDGHGVNARLLGQSVRQDGAFNVIQQILSLDARSVFVHPAERFADMTFDAAHAAIDEGVLLGISHDNTALLSPEGGHVIGADDHLLIFSDEYRVPRPGGVLPRVTVPPPNEPEAARIGSTEAHPLSVLVVRYRPELREILSFLDARGQTRVSVMVPRDEVPRVREALDDVAFKRTKIEVIAGDPLEGADIDRLLLEHRDVALLLAPEVSAAAVADADADQLITLLHLRRAGGGALRTVMEIRSEETRHLVRPVPRREDFLIKRETVGMLLAQELHAICLERPGAWVGPIYHSILEAIGPSVELQPMVAYAGGEPRPTFARILAAARQRGQVAIGVAQEGSRPHLLPRRKERFLAETTQVVVIQASACTMPI